MTVTRRRRRPPAELPSAETILAGLNSEQVAVVTAYLGAFLVVAVAGAGKTRALVHRIAYLVAERGVDPATILAVTFSRKAAQEMNDRLWNLGIRSARVGTWHSLAWEILRAERPEFAEWELDDKDRFRTLVKIVLGHKGMNWKTADLTAVTSFIGLCKANLADPDSDKAREIAEALFEDQPCAQRDPSLLVQAYFEACEAQLQRQMITFDDMLVGAYKCLLDDEVRERWSNRFDFVLQDEAQDENVAQATIAELLAHRHGNYMIVGDPAQSIYGFRGAVPEKLLAFEKEWGAEVISMARNYRSGTEILDAANGVIRAMDPETHLGIEMIPERGVSAEVLLTEHEHMDAEGQETAARLLELHEAGVDWRDVAVLYRTNAQSRGVEEALLSNRIPYVVIGGANFYDRKEVKDLLAYLRAADGRDGFDPVRRCLNAPFRFLGKAFLARVDDAHEDGEAWTETVRRVADSGVQGRQRTSAFEWAGIIDSLSASIEIQEREREVAMVSDDAREHHYPAALLERIIRDTDYMRYITRDEGAETVENNRVSNVRELVRAAERFTTVRELLDYIDETIRAAKAAKDSQYADRVTLCSLHRAKGLEWSAVFVIGANEKILPHGRATDLDEERRLFYVGLTRAMNSLFVSCVRMAAYGEKLLPLEPSRFLDEAGLDFVPLEVAS